MSRYSQAVIGKAIRLRSEGQTYGEIRDTLKLKIPKGTFHSWFKKVVLPKDYYIKVSRLNKENLNKARLIAIESNKIKRQEFLKGLDRINLSVASSIHNTKTAKIALAMLCLGEASKSTKKTSFYFGNSDPKTILLFLELLKTSFDYKLDKIRCTVQCRADQNTEDLEKFWMQVTKIPKELFYKSRVDPRTIGKPTKNTNYRGVLRIDYFDSRVRLELESLANLVYNQLAKGS